MRQILGMAEMPADWDRFAASWDDLSLDPHMADGGRYRRRRHATFHGMRGGELHRAAHRPHYQALEYNRLHGGYDRWFEPIREDIGRSVILRRILDRGRMLFDSLSPRVRSWHVEVHQFRISALTGEAGHPTPEGPHRDGVDYVWVLLVRRHNIAGGTTNLSAPDGTPLGRITLERPLDTVLIDDARLLHGVTPVHPLEAGEAAYRDVLVVTFRGEGSGGERIRDMEAEMVVGSHSKWDEERGLHVDE